MPLFLKQIKQGGPVTVTHPEIAAWYFMTIPEAVRPVDQLASRAAGRDLCIGDGRADQTHGYGTAFDWPFGICSRRGDSYFVVGLRPGEKLREELVAVDEMLVPAGVEKIMRVQSGSISDLGLLIQKLRNSGSRPSTVGPGPSSSCSMKWCRRFGR